MASAQVTASAFSPNRIDLLNNIDAVSFTPAWESRTEVDCADDTGSFPIHYIGLDDLCLLTPDV